MSMRAFGHIGQEGPFGRPPWIKVENIPMPTPGEGQVLVRVHSSSVNHGDDDIWKQMRNSEGYPPKIYGLDAAGIVQEVGKGVTEFKKGDRVYVVMNYEFGTCADYTLTAVRNVALLSDKLSFAQGASIGIPYYTAYKALYTLGGARPGETVLIHGANGAVGTAAVQIAVANGHKVFATAGSEEGLKLVEKLGVRSYEVFNHREQGHMDSILANTRSKGVDVIVEILPNANLDKDLDIIAFRGRIVVVGSQEGCQSFEPRKAMIKEARIVGVNVCKLANESEWTEIKAGVQELQISGFLVPVVSKECTMEDLAQAYNNVDKGVVNGEFVVNVAGN